MKTSDTHKETRYRSVAATVLWALCLLLASPLAMSEQADDTVTVGIVGDNKPYSFDDGPGASGFSVDVLREVARKADLTFQFRAGSWPEIYDAFLRGELDVIDGISFSAERAENILFTEPYHLRQTYLMHNTQRPLRDINTISDLKGLRVGIVRDVYYRDALQAEGVSLTSYDSVHSLIRALAFGWVDVVVGPRLTLQYYANKAGFGFLEIAGPAPLGDLAIWRPKISALAF